MAEELHDRAFQTENIRTVTVVVNPMTDEEAGYSASVPKVGDQIRVIFPDENEMLYLNPECTQPRNDDYEVNYEADSTYCCLH